MFYSREVERESNFLLCKLFCVTFREESPLTDYPGTSRQSRVAHRLSQSDSFESFEVEFRHRTRLLGTLSGAEICLLL